MDDTTESCVLRARIGQYGPLSTLALAVLVDLPLTTPAIQNLLISIPALGSKHPRIRHSCSNCIQPGPHGPGPMSISDCREACDSHRCYTPCAVWVHGGLLSGLTFHKGVLEIVKLGRGGMGPNTSKWFHYMLPRLYYYPNYKTYLRMIVWLTHIPMPVELREGFHPADASSWICLYGFDELRETLSSLGITNRQMIDLTAIHPNLPYYAGWPYWECLLCGDRLYDCRCRGKEDLMAAALLQNRYYSLESYSYTSSLWEAVDRCDSLNNNLIREWLLGRTKLCDDEMMKLLSSKRGITRIKISIKTQNGIPESRRRILRDFGIDIVRYDYTEHSASAYRRKYGYFPIKGKIKKPR